MKFSPSNLIVFFIFLLCERRCFAESSNVIHLDESNWQNLLKNEWMVKFYAPWCPACKSLKSTWEELGSITDKRRISIAKIDVTEAPALSGRFFVTALPTIFHVINGEFRLYRGSRDWKSLQDFIDQKQWQNLDAVSSWKRPDSIQMSIVAYFFKLSHYLKELNNIMNKEYGLPMWVTYGIFAIATVLLGAMLGLIFVCIIDFVFPPKDLKRKSFAQMSDDADSPNKDEIQEDDLEELTLTDNEQLSDSNVDIEDAHNSGTENEGNQHPETSTAAETIRKRKPRKE